MKRLFAIVGLFLSLISNADHMKLVVNGDVLETSKVCSIEGAIDNRRAATYLECVSNTYDIAGNRIVVIDSSGGGINAGQKIIDSIEAEKKIGVKFVCMVRNQASSMAFNILSHCDVRYANKNAHFLVHKARLTPIFQGTYTSKQLREEAATLDAIDEPHRQLNAKKMGLTIKQYDYYADKETKWTTAQLLKMNYLHGISDVTESPDE